MATSSSVQQVVYSALIVTLSLLNLCDSSVAQDAWHECNTSVSASLRGLSACDSKIAWVSGGQGKVLVTEDGGRSWNDVSPPELAGVEIRSIHAWSRQECIIATAGQPAWILKTTNGGASWSRVYENPSPQAFFDGLRFSDTHHGVAFSDPIDGKLLILTTKDRGEHWVAAQESNVPPIHAGEAGFAASNSSLFVNAQSAWLGLGGGEPGPSRIFRSLDLGTSWSVANVASITRGKSAGVFSVFVDSSGIGIAVGGDYQLEKSTEGNIAQTKDAGATWQSITGDPPRGFRSAVIRSKQGPASPWIATGPSGTDISFDGDDWMELSKTGYHTLSIGTDGSIWAAGSKGRVGRLLESAIPSK